MVSAILQTFAAFILRFAAGKSAGADACGVRSKSAGRMRQKRADKRTASP